ncbi:MAG: UDP-N-acetylmuramoyl-L-alanine--D-glutamate ligase [Thermoleophilaceae bacterium]|nr:UDP-N-acetylmuramoyl-L-alanine--D-glutamate ligase [Thermoleophilaceae bacterium]
MSSARPPLPPGPYLVVGLARSGRAAVEMLRPHGEVIATDSGSPEPPPAVESHLGTDGVALLDRVACVVKSPGVPGEAPVVAAARERGLAVLGELELAWRLLPNRFVAVTGTNGKTTTAELLGAIHRAAGLDVAVAGNVGTPLSSLAGTLDPGAVVVCEASSFQLEDADGFAPETALLLNLEEDHLDRHGTFEAYRDAKLRIFARQSEEDAAVVPAGLEPGGRGRRVTFGPAGSDLAVANGALAWRGEPLMDTADVRLRGAHNLENAMGAAAAALASGLDAAPVAAALRTFAGVPHRLEEVATRDGVLYVNDSKATNVSAARRGIEAFDGGVHAILGGSLKGGGFEGLREPVSARCRTCYLVGEAADRLEADLAGTVPLVRCGDLGTAVAEATSAARAGEVVLLSPACASYDQYRDFEERGEHFRRLVTRA